MTSCEQVRELLPLALTGDLGPAHRRSLEAHLAACPDCRRVRAELDSVRRALDAAPTPAVEVDLAAVYAEAARRSRLTARRWRRVAVAGGALAASLLLFLLARLQVEVGGDRVVVRWGPAPAEARPGPVQAPVVVERVAPADAELKEQVKILGDLVRALSEDVNARDRQRQDELALLVARLEVLRQREEQRWEENRRDVTALYTAQFGKRD